MEGLEEIKSDFADNGQVEDVDAASHQELGEGEENMQDFLDKIQKDDDNGKNNHHLNIGLIENNN